MWHMLQRVPPSTQNTALTVQFARLPPCDSRTPAFPPVKGWAHVPCTVQLPVASHVAVIGPPPVLQVPLHTVPATGLLPQSKLPLVGASGLPVHTAWWGRDTSQPAQRDHPCSEHLQSNMTRRACTTQVSRHVLQQPRGAPLYPMHPMQHAMCNTPARPDLCAHTNKNIPHLFGAGCMCPAVSSCRLPRTWL